MLWSVKYIFTKIINDLGEPYYCRFVAWGGVTGHSGILLIDGPDGKWREDRNVRAIDVNLNPIGVLRRGAKFSRGYCNPPQFSPS